MATQVTITPLAGSVGQVLQLGCVGATNPGTWWSLNPEVLSVTSAGVATCVAAGTALIGTMLNGSVYLEGIFTVNPPSLVSIVITGGSSPLTVGQTKQLAVTGTFTDGSTQDVTSQCSFNSSGPGAAINSAGLITALLQSTVTITATVSGISASFSLTVNYVATVIAGASTFRSHLTQVMLNYFDWNDTRVRRGRYTIDAQLLNLAAQQLELSGLRLAREIGATTIHSCPANIDNSGCYWQQRLPGSFNYGIESHTVSAVWDSAPAGIYNALDANPIAASGSQYGKSLSVYDDQLPVPSRVSVNSNVSAVPLANPELFSISGVGDTTTQSWSTQRVGPFTPAFAGRLHFWVDGPGYYETLNIMVRIIGQRAPAPAWSDAQATTSEKVVLSSLGWATSKFGWSSIQQIQVMGLPVGATLSAFTGMFTLPLQPDPDRPYMDPVYRDVVFARYWETGTGFLTEEYLASNYNGWQFVQSYAANPTLSAVAIEPNTWGAFAASGTTLYYFDRREPLPDHLSASALTEEPLYGLDVSIDETQLTLIKFAVLTPVAYAGATNATSYRYLVQTPDGNLYALTPNGFLAEYSQTAGWRNGTPPALSIPLAEQGTYVFSIQTIDSTDGSVVQDSTPWLNPAFTPLASFDLSSLVSRIQGLSFDDRDRLWVWDGATATPLKLSYDDYVIDQDTQAIYLTDSVDGLTIDGLTL